MALYEVLPGPSHGGAPVRDGRSLTSKALARLGPGTIVSEVERVGERVRFKKVAGTGPEGGWVSAQLLSKAEEAKKQEAARSKPYQGKSLLSQVEAKVGAVGAQAALSEAAGKDDGAALALAAVAYIVNGQLKEAQDAAWTAKERFAASGNKDGQASAWLLTAAALLGQGVARDALGCAIEAERLFKEVGDRQMVASALTATARARIGVKEAPAAMQPLKDALAIFRELGDTEGEAAARLTFYEAALAVNSADKALKIAAEERSSYFQGKGDKGAEAQVLISLANKQLTSVDTAAREEALKTAQEAVVKAREAADKKLEASALNAVAAAQLSVTGGTSDLALKAADEAATASKAAGEQKENVLALITISAARLARSQPQEAIQAAQDASKLAKSLGFRSGEGHAAQATAAAHLLMGQAQEALHLAQEAAAVFKEVGEARNEALALQTSASARHALGGPGAKAEAVKLAKAAHSLFVQAEDIPGEASLLLELAAIYLDSEGLARCNIEAASAAERARLLFLVLGDKRQQSLASHAVAQANLRIGDIDAGMTAAMQAAVLSRDAGDRFGEAVALRTATSGALAKGSYCEGLKMAKEVHALSKKIGSSQMEYAMNFLVAQLEEVIPYRTMGPRTFIQPTLQGSRAQRSLFNEKANCVVWSVPMTSGVYMLYSLELLKFVDDLKNVTSKTSVLVTTQGVMGRMTGEPIPGALEGVMGATVWAVVRTVRLESPRLAIATVDIPVGATTHDITECIRAAQIDGGPRGEISFVVDRVENLGPGT